MSKVFNLHGYTVITSLSHGLLGPLKKRTEVLLKAKPGCSPNAFVGMAEALGGFPKPSHTILAVGCTREALFDEDLPEEDREYRKMFGDRIMAEVRGYIGKIPQAQVCFRPDSESPGDRAALMKRIESIFAGSGRALTDVDRSWLADMID